MKVPLHLVRARRASLARLLERHRYLPVAELCRRLGVSEATARRDLVVLAGEKRITRTYGGAIGDLGGFNQAFASFAERRRRAAEAKLRIAKAALKRVRPRATIFLDAGTTLYALAELLRKEPLPLTVVTNSLPIAEALGGSDTIVVHLLGGIFLDRQSILLGPRACAAAREWKFDAAFLGAEGVTERGIWNSSADVTGFQRVVARRAAVSYVCADALKLGHPTAHLLLGWKGGASAPAWRLLTDARAAQLAAAGLDAVARARIDMV